MLQLKGQSGESKTEVNGNGAKKPYNQACWKERNGNVLRRGFELVESVCKHLLGRSAVRLSLQSAFELAVMVVWFVALLEVC